MRNPKPQQGQRPEKRRQSDEILPLPKEVREASANGNRCENIGLWLDRFLTVNRQSYEHTQNAKRRHWVMKLVRDQHVQESQESVDALKRLQESVDALKQRYEAILRWKERQGYVVKRFKAKPVWRFVVGLGAAHVLETSITLHRIFGLPIIPGSALKGAAKAYAQLIEGRTDDDPELVTVFGTTEQAGGVVFWDAIPLGRINFQLDIMNLHYPKYYDRRGKKPPADWDSPRPVFFLTVSETAYLFSIASRSEKANQLLDIAERWLKGALSELGIGAKTSADYGYFHF